MDDSVLLAAFITVIFALFLLAAFIFLVRKARRSKDQQEARKGSVGELPFKGSVRPSSLEGAHDAANVPPNPSAPIPVTSAAPPAAVLVPEAAATAPHPIVEKIAPSTAPDSGEQPKSIFISYRRQDSQHITGRIYDRLSSQFGKEAVFKDVDSIPLGYDFRDHLREQVGRCAVLVAVIGKNWNPPAASGERRLSDPRDHLRIEIESALERHIPVIPVLVDGIEMPAEDELPVTLGRLAYHNGIAIRPDPDFHHDADRLARGIEMLFKQAAR